MIYTDLIDKCGGTQAKAASQLNVTQKTISTWKNGTAMPNRARMKRIAKILSIDEGVAYKKWGVYMDSLSCKES